MAWIYLIKFPKNEVIHNTSISSLWKWMIFSICNWVGMSIILLITKHASEHYYELDKATGKRQ